MKKALLSGLILVALVAVPTTASAINLDLGDILGDVLGDIFGGGNGDIANNAPIDAPNQNVMSVLNNITNWLFAILLVIAAIAIIIAAFKFVTAQGDPEAVKSARQFVLYALIGVLVGILARGLVSLVGRIAGM